MVSPFDTHEGQIISYDEKRGGFNVFVPYDDWMTICKRQYKKVNVQFIDARKLSDKQRRACYALLNCISKFTGEARERTKEYMKLRFLVDDMNETADKIFSLANAPMSLVCQFQKYLVDFIISEDIPCDFDLISFVDDIKSYTYSCLINKKCCVCGKHSDLHHCSGSRVGMGRDRTKIVHEGLEAMPLCREHHEECHMIGQKSFELKYHLEGGIPIDKTICRIYKLKPNTSIID